MSRTVIGKALRDRALACCPGLRIDRVVHRTDKTVLLAGTVDDINVVVKLLVDADDFWQARFTAEIDTYRMFAQAPPPVPVPHLLAADPDTGVLVTTRLPGAPVAHDRYPATLHPQDVSLMLDVAQALSTWSAPPGVLARVWDYPDRFRRYRAEYRLLDNRDEAALNTLAAAAGPLRLGHGDLLPANVLHSLDGMLTGVLDWEFTGWFLPGIDAALLWIVLGHLPGARQRAEQAGGTAPADQAGFWTNVATVCVRELRIHRELPHGPLRTQRLAYLHPTWDTARGRVRELARQL